MTADGKPPMNYETYILPHQLPRVVPREGLVDPLPGNPDEEFFIRTHQALEIWFAQLLAEMAHARRLLAQPAPTYVPETAIPEIVKHIRRAARIFDLIGQHLPVLETLDTASFYNFRKHLFGASGTLRSPTGRASSPSGRFRHHKSVSEHPSRRGSGGSVPW